MWKNSCYNLIWLGRKKWFWKVLRLWIDDNGDYDDFVYEDEDNEGDDADEEDV